MKRTLTLTVVDLPADVAGVIREKLELAAQVRPIDDRWRDVAAGLLMHAFPGCWVHRGGHHIALHAQGPMRAGTMESTPCMGRIVEGRGA